MHSQKPTIIRRQPVHGVRSSIKKCIPALPSMTPESRDLFNACANGTALKNDNKTPIGQPVASFQIPALGGIVGLCCADYTELKNTIASAKNLLQPIVCNIEPLKNSIPEQIMFPFPAGQQVPVAFPMRRYMCQDNNAPDAFVPPQAPKDLPPYR